ncbi:MAG: hypothetical protein ABI415_02380, partial [Flavitalea sp.]
YICLAAPLLILGIDFINNIEWYQKQLKFDESVFSGIRNFSHSIFGSFKIGYELLIYNGLLTFMGLWAISKPGDNSGNTGMVTE